jgi:large subunit ribosomal protein L15
MPLSRRLPHRGFNNKNFRIEYNIVNLKVLEAKFNDGEDVTLDTLINKGILKKHAPKLVKILGEGMLKKKLIIHANAFSKGATQAIEKAGGKALLMSKETRSGSATTEL